MPDREKVINKVKAIVADMQEEVDEWKDYSDSELRGGLTCDCDWWYKTLQTLKDALALLKAQEPITGETSDGYHTFNELYHHRAVLFSVIVANYKDRAWKSVRHHDGTMYDGMFIVGIDTPDGQATYHYDIDPYWDMFDCKVREFAPEWDGHTPAQAIERIGKLKAQEQKCRECGEATSKAIQELQTKLKAQEPRLVTIDDFKGADEYGWLPAWCEEQTGGAVYCECILADALKENGVRYWTGKPSDEQREAVKWGV